MFKVIRIFLSLVIMCFSFMGLMFILLIFNINLFEKFFSLFTHWQFYAGMFFYLLAVLTAGFKEYWDKDQK
jgi:hypothetical protein